MDQDERVAERAALLAHHGITDPYAAFVVYVCHGCGSIGTAPDEESARYWAARFDAEENVCCGSDVFVTIFGRD
jgi:hypothetical protein